jgi:hypothetical protein
MICQLPDEESRIGIVRTVNAYWRISASISVLACLLAGAAEAPAMAKARAVAVEKSMMIAIESIVKGMVEFRSVLKDEIGHSSGMG